jgi:hypothetical protein
MAIGNLNLKKLHISPLLQLGLLQEESILFRCCDCSKHIIECENKSVSIDCLVIGVNRFYVVHRLVL